MPIHMPVTYCFSYWSFRIWLNYSVITSISFIFFLLWFHGYYCLFIILVIYCCIIDYHKTQLLSQHYCGWGVRERLSRVFLVQGFSSDCSKDISWGRSHLTSWLGQEDLLPCGLCQEASLPHWLLAECLSSSPYGPLHRTFEYHRSVGADFLLSKRSRIEKTRKRPYKLYDLVSETTHYHFIIFIRSKSSHTQGE